MASAAFTPVKPTGWTTALPLVMRSVAPLPIVKSPMKPLPVALVMLTVSVPLEIFTTPLPPRVMQPEGLSKLLTPKFIVPLLL
jgi:hypothetical protein